MTHFPHPNWDSGNMRVTGSEGDSRAKERSLSLQSQPWRMLGVYPFSCLCEMAAICPYSVIQREACPGDSSPPFPGRLGGSSFGRSSGTWSRKAWWLCGGC